MTLSDRDRKLLIFLVPIVVIAAFWFLLISPKREEATQAAMELDQQEQRLDQARATADAAKGAKTDFAADYGEIVRLGKAIPSTIDMPSLIVQLDRAAAGTSIRFTRIATGERQATTSVAAPPPESSSTGTTPATPTDAGGAQAQSGPGTAAESANNTAAASNEQAQSGAAAPSDTQTSTPAGAAPATGGAGTASAAPGLETVPLELEFVGNFFNLADFFHDVKRFVHVAESNVTVGGRLITIDRINFSSDPELFPRLTAQLTATIYLSPVSEGVTAGATPAGPATPAAESSDPSGSPAPAATAIPIGQ